MFIIPTSANANTYFTYDSGGASITGPYAFIDDTREALVNTYNTLTGKFNFVPSEGFPLSIVTKSRTSSALNTNVQLLNSKKEVLATVSQSLTLDNVNSRQHKYTFSSVPSGVVYVKLNVVSGSGNWSVSSVAADIDLTPPNIPTGLAATTGNGKVVLTWNKVSGDIYQYRIYQDGTLVSSVASTSAVITGLTNGTTYKFEVSAVNSSGVESARVATTAKPELILPATPQNLVAKPGNGKVDLSWSKSTETNLVGYLVYQDGVKVTPTPITGAAYTVTGLTNDKSYSFQISAVNDESLESVKSNAVTATPFIAPPDAPKSLIAKPDDQKVTLSWLANKEPDLKGYLIYQDGTQVTASPINETSYTITGLQNKRTYNFQVSAVNTSDKESVKSAAAAIPDNPPPPSAPIGLTAQPENEKITLNWTKNPETNLQGYFIYQDGKKITTTPVSGTALTVNGLQNEKKYTFQVSAINTRNQESAKSTVVEAAPTGIVPQIKAQAGKEKVTVTWSTIQGATEYRIYRDGVQVSAVTGTSWIDTDVVNGTKYEYKVSSVVGGVVSEKSSPAFAIPSNMLEFGSGGLPGLLDVIKSAFSFAGQYSTFLIFVCGILVAMVIFGFIVYIFTPAPKPKGRKAAGKEKAAKAEKPKRTRVELTPEEKERKKREQKLWKVRLDKYELLTRSGRISEREQWIKSAKIEGIKEKYEAREKRRERAAAAPRTAGTKQRDSRQTRAARPGRGVRSGRK